MKRALIPLAAIALALTGCTLDYHYQVTSSGKTNLEITYSMSESELSEYQGNLNAAESFFTGMPKTQVDCQYLLKRAKISDLYGSGHKITVEEIPADTGIKCRINVPEITGSVGENMLVSDASRIIIPGEMLKDLGEVTDTAISKASVFGDRPDMTVTVTMPDDISSAQVGGEDAPFDGKTVTMPFDKATGGVEVETGLGFWVNVVLVILLVLMVAVPVAVVVLVVVLVRKRKRNRKVRAKGQGGSVLPGQSFSQGGEDAQP